MYKKTEVVSYFDGLGRPVQTIAIKATPLGRDVVTPVEYNNVGKQVKDYFPVPQKSTQNGAVYTNPLEDASVMYGNEKIFSEKVYDNVYTNRIKQMVPAGNAWSQKPLNMGYDTNIDGEVKRYTISTSWLESRTESGIILLDPYSGNKLIKTSVTDEEGNTTTEFQNGEGQIILVRKNDGTQDVDTYYLYNEYGQLVYVIPPKASAAIKNLTTGQQISVDVLNNLCYQYRYEGSGKLVEKKLPGKGWQYMVYDKQDRLILTQDANLRSAADNNFGAKGWMFTKYDKFGRVVYSGFFISDATRSDLQTAINNMSVNPGNNEERSASSFSYKGMDVFYTKNAFPTENTIILNVNYYDNYPSYPFSPSFPTTIFNQTIINDSPNMTINTKTLPTMSLVKNIEDDTWTKNYIWYDEKNRAIGTYSINHLGGYTRTESELDFVGVVKQSKIYHKRISEDQEKVIVQTFEYDQHNRLKKQWHQVNNNPSELLTENVYNEKSQLSNKKVGNNLQSIDYVYDIRGSLAKVNEPSNLGTKLFGYEIHRHDPLDASLSSGKYNGNVTEVTWKTAVDSKLKRYNYSYDPLNRLKKGTYSEPDTSIPKNDFYNEIINYDINDNIISLQRNTKGGSNNASLIDNLTYDYTGNRLNHVVDLSGNYSGYPDVSGNTISYDDNGNMKDHIDKGVLQINYNYMNLPSYIKFDKGLITRGGFINESIYYTYRADGTKIKKIYNRTPFGGATIMETEITEYLDGFQYQTLKKKNGEVSLALKFIPTAEGYYNFENNKYIYNYTDHLGNIRLSYFSNSNGSAEVLQENNYYPFGQKHEDYNGLVGNTSYHYEYNGKEFQQETGWSDYGARMYMPDIARWGVIDPLAETSRRLSPYNYAVNNPINFIDPDGRKAMPDRSMPDNGPPQPMGGILGFYARGGIGTRAGILGLVGYEDGIGGFYSSGLEGGGGATSKGLSFSSKEGIMFIQSYFSNGGSIGALFSMVDQLKNAGWKDPANTKAKFDDISTLTGKVPGLVELATMTKAEFIDNTGGNCPNKTEFHRIWINMNNAQNILKLAFTVGHEMNHSFGDLFFRGKFGEITRQSQSSRFFQDSFGFFQEVMGLSWEIKLGSERYGERSGFKAAEFYYGPKGLGYTQKSVDTISNYLYELNTAWNFIYQSKLK
ncbi:RHS repeat domain-containing protein [Chryseobacterium sp. JK1]|uniref:RHS repeat domain-containing protein n=1 Tax=Chryseobacterium sp. JK1 TaxID=874294 RepID=UPI003D6876CC